MAISKCDRGGLAKKIRAAKKMQVAPIMKPLRNHLLRLAINSAKHGYCQRAGSEVAKAVKIAEENPTTAVYNDAVIQAHAKYSKRGKRK